MAWKGSCRAGEEIRTLGFLLVGDVVHTYYSSFAPYGF
jgi:hypothetical protein